MNAQPGHRRGDDREGVAGWAGRVRQLASRIGRAWRRAEQAYDAVFAARWGHPRQREARDRADLLRALALLETLGVDNPARYETLELIPYMIGDLHRWHQRLGEDQLGLPGGCC